jgi:hypothetical protein
MGDDDGGQAGRSYRPHKGDLQRFLPFNRRQLHHLGRDGERASPQSFRGCRRQAGKRFQQRGDFFVVLIDLPEENGGTVQADRDFVARDGLQQGQQRCLAAFGHKFA